MKEIAFTKVKLPFGWLGNMSPHPLLFWDVTWRTAEALFQALRFSNKNIIDEIRAQIGPMQAKFVAKKHASEMIIPPRSVEDVDNMHTVLCEKLDQHPDLGRQLDMTEDALIIEDCSRRANESGLFWGAVRTDGGWRGDNVLGRLWMEIRDRRLGVKK